MYWRIERETTDCNHMFYNANVFKGNGFQQQRWWWSVISEGQEPWPRPQESALLLAPKRPTSRQLSFAFGLFHMISLLFTNPFAACVQNIPARTDARRKQILLLRPLSDRLIVQGRSRTLTNNSVNNTVQCWVCWLLFITTVWYFCIRIDRHPATFVFPY